MFSKWDDNLLSIVFKALSQEFVLPINVLGGMAQYRQSLCLSFFYKFFLFVRSQTSPNVLLEREASALTVRSNSIIANFVIKIHAVFSHL